MVLMPTVRLTGDQNKDMSSVDVWRERAEELEWGECSGRGKASKTRTWIDVGSEADQKDICDALKTTEPTDGHYDEKVSDSTEYQRQTVHEADRNQLSQRNSSQWSVILEA